MSAKRKKPAKFRRVLLKLSGEALQGDGESICPRIIKALALEVKGAASIGAEVALVVGGGNIWRGKVAAESGMERATADYMGMLATVINGLALQDALEKVGVQTRVMSSIDMRNVAEPFIRRRAMRHLEKGRVVIFAAGTGNPYFTTDTTAALRAAEIGASVLLKATKVDGVYDKDPKLHADAVKFERVAYIDALHRRLRVMDAAAFSLCMENRIPIMVFDMFKKGNIRRAICGQKVGTLVSD